MDMGTWSTWIRGHVRLILVKGVEDSSNTFGFHPFSSFSLGALVPTTCLPFHQLCHEKMATGGEVDKLCHAQRD